MARYTTRDDTMSLSLMIASERRFKILEEKKHQSFHSLHLTLQPLLFMCSALSPPGISGMWVEHPLRHLIHHFPCTPSDRPWHLNPSFHLPFLHPSRNFIFGSFIGFHHTVNTSHSPNLNLSLAFFYVV